MNNLKNQNFIRDDSVDCDIVITNVPNKPNMYKRLLEELTSDVQMFGPIEVLQPLKEFKSSTVTNTTCCFLRYYNRTQHQHVCDYYNEIPACLDGNRLYFSVNKKTIAQINNNKQQVNDNVPLCSRTFQLKWGIDKATQTSEEVIVNQKQEELKVLCTNCKKEINYELYPRHFRFCTTYATECTFCQQSVVYANMNDHEKDCAKRPSKCDYCDMEMYQSVIKKHELDCGNRTDTCDNCYKYVKKKDQKTHNCRRPDVGSFGSVVLQACCPVCLGEFSRISADEVYVTICGHLCCKTCLYGLGFRQVFEPSPDVYGFSIRTGLPCPVCRTHVLDDAIHVVKIYSNC